MSMSRRFALGAAALVLVLAGYSPAGAETTLLNVSYDPTREFYQEYNAVFAKQWKEKAGADVLITGDLKHFGALMERDDLPLRVRSPRAFLLEGP